MILLCPFAPLLLLLHEPSARRWERQRKHDRIIQVGHLDTVEAEGVHACTNGEFAADQLVRVVLSVVDSCDRDVRGDIHRAGKQHVRLHAR